MADELKYAVSAAPISVNAPGGSSGEIEHKNIDTRAARVGASSTIAWDGAEPVVAVGGTAAYVDGVLQHTNSGGASGTLAISTTSSDGLWIKNTGFKYDASKPGNIDRSSPEDTILVVTNYSSISSSLVLCKLIAGGGIFVPVPRSSITLSDGEEGSPVAVEFIVYT